VGLDLDVWVWVCGFGFIGSGFGCGFVLWVPEGLRSGLGLKGSMRLFDV
jgi:hypothetical protein